MLDVFEGAEQTEEELEAAFNGGGVVCARITDWAKNNCSDGRFGKDLSSRLNHFHLKRKDTFVQSGSSWGLRRSALMSPCSLLGWWKVCVLAQP